jgi:hypothetical protein
MQDRNRSGRWCMVKRDRAEGGGAKAEMMMKVAGTFLAQSGDSLMRIDLPGLFDGNQFIALVAPHCPPTSRILFPAVQREIYLTRRSFQKSRCLTEDLVTSRAQSVRRCNPIPPPTLTSLTWTTETTTATPMATRTEDPTAVEPMASPTSSATRLPPLKQRKQRTVHPTLSMATTSQSATLVS